MENYNGGYETTQAQQIPQYGYGDYNIYYGAYQPVVQQQIKVPQNQNALTNEEIIQLKSARPSNVIDLNIDTIDVLKGQCTHKENGIDLVKEVNDGTGDVWCPLCQVRWNPTPMGEEEVTELVNKLLDQMQNAKWTGDLPVELCRQLFTLIPLLQKYPKVHKYAMDNFSKYYSQHQYLNAQDASIYAQFNSLMTPNYNAYINPQAPSYLQYAQQAVASAAPQQGIYYGQQPQAAPQVSPYVNPMQAPAAGQQPYYQQQPQAVPQVPIAPYGHLQQNPTFATPQAPVQNVPQPYVPQAQQTTTPDGATVTPNVDGSVTSTKKIEI